MLKRICSDNNEAMRLIEDVTVGKHGGDRKSENIKINEIKLDSIKSSGPTKSYLLRRLYKKYPETYEALQKGEYPSVRQAAISAGIVKEPTSFELFMRAQMATGAQQNKSWMDIHSLIQRG